MITENLLSLYQAGHKEEHQSVCAIQMKIDPCAEEVATWTTDNYDKDIERIYHIQASPINSGGPMQPDE